MNMGQKEKRMSFAGLGMVLIGCVWFALSVVGVFAGEAMMFGYFLGPGLAIRVERNLDHEDVQEYVAELFCTRGVPTHLRSYNGPEFIATQLRQWLTRLDVKTLFIEPGSPWENGYIESFNGKLRDELLDREIFFTLEEAKILIARWREEYNHIRPHSALGYRPPAPPAWLLAAQLVSAPGLT